jgi:hypothetical protein
MAPPGTTRQAISGAALGEAVLLLLVEQAIRERRASLSAPAVVSRVTRRLFRSILSGGWD